MRALLDVLARGPRFTKTRVATAAFAISLASAAVVGARERLHRAPPPCPSPERAFDGMWDDGRRAAVEGPPRIGKQQRARVHPAVARRVPRGVGPRGGRHVRGHARPG